MRTLALVHGRVERPEQAELERLEAADEWPRVTLFERELQADLLDERAALREAGARRPAYRALPIGVVQALEAYRRRSRYDALLSWAEHLGLPLAALLKATGARIPHVALFSWISRPKKAAILRRVHSHVHRLVLWSTAQYRFAVDELGIPPSKIVLLRWLVDQRYWRPLPVEPDRICSAGREMRDYATLVEALRGWDVPCHVAANAGAGRKDRWVADLARIAPPPPNVTIGALAYPELRALYARSRFVVVPLFPTDTDNGVTVLTEAMAMGKAVICTRVAGQRDVVDDGVNGLLVPPRDPAALRAAMEHLWRNPAECERMGREGRRRVERLHTLDRFVAGVRRAVEEAIEEQRAAPLGAARRARA
jgi:glycosyltransferase involved in cell wall biosynthesis